MSRRKCVLQSCMLAWRSLLPAQCNYSTSVRAILALRHRLSTHLQARDILSRHKQVCNGPCHNTVAVADNVGGKKAHYVHPRAVYALGLYVDPAAVKQKVAPNFRGQAPEALSNSQQLLDGAWRL